METLLKPLVPGKMNSIIVDESAGMKSGDGLIDSRNTENELRESVGDIVAKDVRKAEIFNKYGIDFCCGGKLSLQKVCEEKGLDFASIKAELDILQGTPSPITLNYSEWSPGFLADYIFNQHHKFFYREDPEIKEIMQKVADHHSVSHPFLLELHNAYLRLSKELHVHFIKEEQVLFPFINTLEQVKLTDKKSLLEDIYHLSSPLQIMQVDHEKAGAGLALMREITGGYTLPPDACNSFELLYKKLAELEADLHLHIHLENNILFPAAMRLEKEVRHEE